MPLGFVGSTWATATITTGGTTVSVDLTSLTGGSSSSVSEGDFVLLFCASGYDGSGGEFTCTASGFSSLAHLYGNDTRDVVFDLLGRYATAPPPTSATVTMAYRMSGQVASVVARVYSGSTPEPTQLITAAGADTGDATCPAITAESTGSVVICCAAAVNATDAGWNNVGAALPNGESFNAIGSAKDTLLAIGVTSLAFDSTLTPGRLSGAPSTSNSWAAISLELSPAVDVTLTGSVSATATLALTGDVAIDQAFYGTVGLGATLGITGDLVQVCELGPDEVPLAAGLSIAGDLDTTPAGAVGAISYVTGVIGTSTNANITLTLPTASMLEHDVVFAAGINGGTNTSSVSVSSGWASRAHVTSAIYAGVSYCGAHKAQGAALDTQVVFTYSTTSQSARAAVAQVFRGVHNSFPYGLPAYVTTNSACDVDPPTATCLVTGLSLVIGAIGARYTNTKVLNSLSSGYGSANTAVQMTAANSNAVLCLSSASVAPGAINPTAWDVTGSTESSDAYISGHYILVPDSATDIEFVGATSALHYISTSGGLTGTVSLTSLTGGSSSSASEGDLLLLYLSRGSDAADNTPTVTDWTAVEHRYQSGTNKQQVDIFRLAAGGSPPTQVVFAYTTDGVTSANAVACIVSVYRNVHFTASFAEFTTYAVNSHTITPVAVTGTYADSVMLLYGALSSTNGEPTLAPQTARVWGPLAAVTGSASATCIDADAVLHHIWIGTSTVTPAAVSGAGGVGDDAFFHAIELVPAAAVALSPSAALPLAAALAITGDLDVEVATDITLSVTTCSAFSAGLSVAGSLAVAQAFYGQVDAAVDLDISGDIEYELAHAVEVSTCSAFSAALGISGDIEYGLAHAVEVSTCSAFSAALSISGDIECVVGLSVAGQVAFGAALSVTGDIAFAAGLNVAGQVGLGTALAITGDLVFAEAVPVSGGRLPRVRRVYKSDRPEDGTIELVEHPAPAPVAASVRDLVAPLGESIMASAFRQARERAEQEGAKRARGEAARKALLKAQARAEREHREALDRLELELYRAELAATRKRQDDEALMLLLLY